MIVHGLPQAQAALASNLPVLLLSAQGAAAYAGAAWWRAMIEAALEGRSPTPDALDCSDLAGRALEALHLGCRIIVLHPCPAYPAILERANGALILPQRPPALDLDHPGALRRLEAWLQGDSNPSIR